jgi:hypothetical protein
MTGMKEGAGEDPFAETTDDGAAAADSTSDDPSTGDGPENGTESSDQASATRQPPTRIPYKFRRDGVKDGRDRVPLFLKPDTKDAERDALREFEDRFDGDVSLTDLREALEIVGLQHLDEVQDQLAEWGYGMTFEE